MRATVRPLRRVPYVLVTVAIATSGLVSCSDDPSRDTLDYCASLAKQQALLVMPVATADDVAPAVDRYLDMARRAPLVVQEPWRRLAALMQAAATIDISNAAARLDVIQQAYETKSDADLIVTHAQATCAITIDISGTTTTTTSTTVAATAPTVLVSEPLTPAATAPSTAAAVPESPPTATAEAVTTPPPAPVASGG